MSNEESPDSFVLVFSAKPSITINGNRAVALVRSPIFSGSGSAT